MGIIEEESKKKKSRHDIQQAILLSVSLVGALALNAVAPKTIKYLRDFGFDPTKRQNETIKRSRERLIKRRLLVYENGFLRLTPQGERELKILEMKNQEKSKKWDGRWRMLIFDIPEKRGLLRRKIRNTLLDIGFLRLQDSVWVYPYDCEDLVSLLKADFKVGKDLLYLIVDSLENDKKLRESFNLPMYL